MKSTMIRGYALPGVLAVLAHISFLGGLSFLTLMPPPSPRESSPIDVSLVEIQEEASSLRGEAVPQPRPEPRITEAAPVSEPMMEPKQEPMPESMPEPALAQHDPVEAEESVPAPMVVHRRLASDQGRSVATPLKSSAETDFVADAIPESAIRPVSETQSNPGASAHDAPTRPLLRDGSAADIGKSGHARLAYSPRPVYPKIARESGWEGAVHLRVLVNVAGIPSAVQVVKSSGYEVLDEAALQAVHGWKFSPAKDGGFAVHGSFDLVVQFRLDQAG